MAYKSKYTGAEVDNLLSKADTALQQYEEKYKGTVTGININGVVKNPTDGIIDVGDIITSDDVYYIAESDFNGGLIPQYEFSKIRSCKILILQFLGIDIVFTARNNDVAGIGSISFGGVFGNTALNAIFSPNEDGGATFELQVEPVYTFKTINGEEILGEGNIDIEGGIQTETDPIFMASPAAGISQENIALWNNKVDSSTLSTVAISGNYDDLSNKPTIPDAVTESTISG